MPRLHDLQPSFNAGELDPRLAARLDFTKYGAGLETCLNFIPLSEGGAMRRSGSRYVAEAQSSSTKGRLKRFQFNVTQAYIIEFCEQTMRFFRNQAQISAADTDAAVSNGTFPSGITDWDDRSTGAGSIAHDATNDRLSLVPGGMATTDIGWAEQDITTTSTNVEHVLKFRVIGAPGDKIEFQVGTTSTGTELLTAVEKEAGYHCVAFTPTASPFYIQFRNIGSVRNKTVQIDDVSLIDDAGVEIDTPWSEADLFDVEGPQSADVLYLFHQDYPTYKLQRFGHTTWSLVEVPWQDGPYLDENKTQTTITPSADSGYGVTFTLSSTEGVNDNQGWLATDVGRSIRYRKVPNGPWSWAVITSITSSLIAVADIRDTASFGQVWQVDDTPDETAFVDTTAAANSAANNDWTIFPAVEATGDYCAFGFKTKFSQITFDYANGVAGIGGTLLWQYWNGSSFVLLLGVADNTNGFTTAAADGLTASWSIPTDWVPRSINGSEELYYIRAYVVNTYATNPVFDQGFMQVRATPESVTSFRLGAWSGTTGYPKEATFFEQRLYSAGTSGQPQTFWASQTGDFENMAPDDGEDTIEADDALSFTLSADDVNAIQWMASSQDVLVIGTRGGEWVPTSDGVVITPLDITVRRQTTHGSAGVHPVTIGNAILFVQAAGRALREFGFNFNVDGFLAPDMARLARHSTLSGIAEVDYAEERESLIVAARNDGVMLLVSYRREEDVVGWSRHIMGGSFQCGNAVVESVAVIPGNDGAGQIHDSTDRDEIWVIVKRTINGATKRYVEFLERDFEDGDAPEDAYYSDSIITLDNPIAVTNATQANPVVIKAASHGLSDGDLFRVTDIVGMVELNGRSFKAASVSTDFISLTDPDDDSNIDGTGYTEYATGGNVNELVSTITGLDHLEKQTVKIWADGAVQTEKLVSSGQITLTDPASVVQIGLGYTHQLKTLKISDGNPAGTQLGKHKRIYGMTFSLLNSHTLKYGPASGNLQDMDFRVVSDAMDTAVPLFTGDQFIEFEGDWGRDTRVFVESDAPAPFTLLAMAPEISSNPLK